jgi:hypothetical protein
MKNTTKTLPCYRHQTDCLSVEVMGYGDLKPGEQFGPMVELDSMYNNIVNNPEVARYSHHVAGLSDEKGIPSVSAMYPYFTLGQPYYCSQAKRYVRQQIHVGMQFSHPDWTQGRAAQVRDRIFRALYPAVKLVYRGPNHSVYAIWEMTLNIRMAAPHTSQHLEVYLSRERSRMMSKLSQAFRFDDTWKDAQKTPLTSFPIYHDSGARGSKNDRLYKAE